MTMHQVSQHCRFNCTHSVYATCNKLYGINVLIETLCNSWN